MWMWYGIQFIIFPFLVDVTKLSHVSKNYTGASNNDVIVTYAGHAEAMEPPKPVRTVAPENDTPKTDNPESPEFSTTESTPDFGSDTESVFFVPNEKPVLRTGNYHDDRLTIDDIVDRKRTIGDILNGGKMNAETESPPGDILFISGKNNENVEKPSRREPSYEPYENRRSAPERRVKKIHLDCSNLDCNNTLKAVCGGKMENRQWKYRVFLNECYFRKVNCDFKYEDNRYKIVPDDHCKTVGSHYSERPFVYHPWGVPGVSPMLRRETPAPVVNPRRSFSSRRSLNIEVNGSFCSHLCPPTCPEDYSPECAVTSRGQRRVFLNHCKLDFHSCATGTVWHRRPLSECVGNEKADIRQNRAFIGWMQKVGIVDGKGRLVMA